MILMMLSGEHGAATFVNTQSVTRGTHATTLKTMQARLNLQQFVTAKVLYVQNMTTVRSFGIESSHILTIILLCEHMTGMMPLAMMARCVPGLR